LRTVHHQNPTTLPKQAAVHFGHALNQSLSATDFGTTSGTGWSLQVPAAPGDIAPTPGQSSFAERFAAVFEVILFERPLVMRRMEGLFSTAP